MRKITIRAKNKEDLTSLQFFSQVLDELLFDHSDDSYKAPALNTYSRVRELQRLIHEITISNVSTNTLIPFIDEVEDSVLGDEVFDDQEKNLMLLLVSNIRSSLNDPTKMKTSASLLHAKVDRYFERLISALQHIVFNDPKNKIKLCRLSADFVVQCEVEGYSRRFVYSEVKKKLLASLYSYNAVATERVIAKFFECFSREKKKWVVIFATDEKQELKDLAERFGIKVFSEFDPQVVFTTRVKEYISICQKDGKIFLSSEVEAFDPVRAREMSAMYIEIFASALAFCEHGHLLNISKDAVVVDANHNTADLIRGTLNPMQVRTASPKDLEQQLNLLDKTVSNHQKDLRSISKLFNVLRLHRVGLQTSDSANQLIDLWAALEGFMPKPGKDAIRILHFSEQLSSVLTLTYAEKLFSVLTKEVLNHSKVARNFIESLGFGKNEIEAAVILTVAEELEHKRKEITQILGGTNPLLCFRIWQLWKRFSTRKTVGETLRAHQKKIRWQICRIYNARNSIVHSADSPRYVDTLVEHLHGYTDALFWSILKLSITSERITSIDQAMTLLAAHEQLLLEEYNTKKFGDENCSTANALQIVFGVSNPVSPIMN